MTQVVIPSPTAASDAIIAMPEKHPSQSMAPAFAVKEIPVLPASGLSAVPMTRRGRRDARPRSGNPNPAPRRAGTTRARLTKSLVMRQAQSVRRTKRAKNSQPSLSAGTCPPGSPQQLTRSAASSVPIAGARRNGTLAQNAGIAFLAVAAVDSRAAAQSAPPGKPHQDPIHPRTVVPPTSPASAPTTGGDNHPMHRGTAVHPVGSVRLAAGSSSAEGPRPDGTFAQNARTASLRIRSAASRTAAFPAPPGETPPKPRTPSHGGGSDQPGQCTHHRRRQSPLAPWHGGAFGRLRRVGARQPVLRGPTPGWDARAECPNRVAPNQVYGQSHTGLPDPDRRNPAKTPYTLARWCFRPARPVGARHRRRHRGTAVHPTGWRPPAHPPDPDGTLAQNARTASPQIKGLRPVAHRPARPRRPRIAGQNPIHPRTVAPPTSPAATAITGVDQHPIQRGAGAETVAPPTAPASPAAPRAKLRRPGPTQPAASRQPGPQPDPRRRET